jgi:hypothetical protein
MQIDLLLECADKTHRPQMTNSRSGLQQWEQAQLLRETARRLSHESMRLVWQKAKFELKARR